MIHAIQHRSKPLIQTLQPSLEKNYVKLMMDVISRGLVSASRNDNVLAREVAGFKPGMTIQMIVLPHVAQFTLEVTNNSEFQLIEPVDKADLTVKIKHVALAFLIFTFQEGTAAAFAGDRMVADGDIGDAVRFVRCLNRMEVIILPKMVAKLAIKDYPSDVSLFNKLTTASKVYAGVLKTFIS